MIKENLSYKIIALLIAIILWMTLLARKEFVHTVNLDLDFITDSKLDVISHDGHQVRLKISGNRAHLKVVSEKLSQTPLMIDLKGKPVGFYRIEIPLSQIQLPEGVRLLGVRPQQLDIEIHSRNQKEQE